MKTICPDVIVEANDQKLHIVIDKIKSQSYDELYNMVNQNVSSADIGHGNKR